MCSTPWARAPERGTGPRERMAGPRGMDPLGPVPEDSFLWARAQSKFQKKSKLLELFTI